MKGTLEPARRNTDKSRQKCGADINGETPLRCVWKLTDLSKSVKMASSHRIYDTQTRYVAVCDGNCHRTEKKL